METLHIANVRKIAKGKTIDGNARTVNIVVIDTTNGKPSIVRNYSQFLQDLKNSFLLDDNINSMTHPDVRDCLSGLRRGMISGEITYGKKGDTWVVTDESRMITDPTHVEFGKAKIGDTRTLLEDNSRVEGFLSFYLSKEARTDNANAKSKAKAELALSGAFEDYGNVENASLVESAADALPQEILDEVVGKDDKSKKK